MAAQENHETETPLPVSTQYLISLEFRLIHLLVSKCHRPLCYPSPSSPTDLHELSVECCGCVCLVLGAWGLVKGCFVVLRQGFCNLQLQFSRL